MFLPLATSGCVVPVKNFWSSILLYNNRPNVVNNRLIGAKTLYFYKVHFTSTAIKHIYELFNSSAILYEIRTVDELSKASLSNLILNLLQPYDKTVTLNEITVEQFNEESDGLFVTVKVLLPKLKYYEKSVEIVVFDKNDNRTTFIAISKNEKQQLAPPFQYHVELMSSGHIRVLVENIEDAESNSAEWLADKLFYKLVKWAEEYDSSVITTPSLSLILIDKYSDLYCELKKKYGQRMVEIWPENTDPLKFVYEDIAIATYLICLWNTLTPNHKPTFVDLGCGNGLLAFILQEEGFPGVGIDVRKRKIWSLYSPHVKLQEKTIVPSADFLFPDADWIIGNHSDELTPWIPVIAARSSYKTNFFLLPCCFYDFSGKKYSRINTKNPQYFDYLEYIENICHVCGFVTKRDKLRIPSTKKQCIISVGRNYNEESFKEIDVAITGFIAKRTQIVDINESKSNWVKSFTPRPVCETVRNCTKLDRDLINRILKCIVNRLLTEENRINNWNAGGSLTIPQLIQSVDQFDLKKLKKECGGIQTLLRNHRYIFDLSDKKVKIRVPPEIEAVQKYKEKPCWFYKNHPEGCLHKSENCAYNHT